MTPTTTARLSALGPTLALALAGLTSACTVMPSGPAIAVIPGSEKTLDEFAHDDAVCRQFAANQVAGTSSQQAAEQSAVKTAVVATAVGTAAGAAFGGGEGAAIGAGAGLLGGSLLGMSAASASGHATQARYDTAYAQCMQTQGNRLPPHAAVPGPYADPYPTPAPSYSSFGFSYGYSSRHHHGHYGHRHHYHGHRHGRGHW